MTRESTDDPTPPDVTGRDDADEAEDSFLRTIHAAVAAAASPSVDGELRAQIRDAMNRHGRAIERLQAEGVRAIDEFLLSMNELRLLLRQAGVEEPSEA